MKLDKKKALAAKVLGVGIGRITLNSARLEEIKDAITKQDIRDLFSDGAIAIKEIKGRRKVEKRKNRRGHGKVKKKIGSRKQDYVRITRRLRSYVREMSKQKRISHDKYVELRRKIKAKAFKSRAHMEEHL